MRHCARACCAEPALIPGAVEESVRLYGAVGLLPRYTETGARDRRGRTSRRTPGCCSACAPPGAMPRSTPTPSASTLTRHAQRLVTFGGMPHFCLGVHLAKAELATSLELLLARLPGLRLAQRPDAADAPRCCAACVELPVAFDALLPAR